MSDNLDRDLRALLRGSPPPEPLPDGAEERIFARVREQFKHAQARTSAGQELGPRVEQLPAPVQSVAPKAGRLHRLVWPAAVAALVLLVLGAYAWLHPSATPQVAQDLHPKTGSLPKDEREKARQVAGGPGAGLGAGAEEMPEVADFNPPPDRPVTEKLKDGSTVEIAGGSRVRVTTWARRPRPLLDLNLGMVTCRVAKAPGTFTVRTPVGEARAMGTEYSVRVEEQAGANAPAQDGGKAAMTPKGIAGLAMTVLVLSGEVLVSGPEGASQLACAGESVAFTKKAQAAERFQSGQLVPRLADGTQGEPLEVRRHEVGVTIRDQITLVEVDQVFYNPSPQRIEGTFYFPLPNGATISRLAMYVGDNLMEGEIAEAARARRTFEALKIQNIDPALLEWAGGNNFKMRVFPIEPKSEKRVLISYYQVLEKEENRVRFTYPLMSDALQTNPVGKIALKVTYDSQAEILGAETPGLATKWTQRDPHRIALEYVAEQARPDRHFELACKLAPAQAELAVLPFWHASGQEGYFLFVFSPRLEAFASERGAGNRFVFVVDKSGGLGARHLALAVKTVVTALGKLNPQDHFGIVAYDAFAKEFKSGLVPATPAHVASASVWLQGLQAEGASDLSAAWRAAANLAGAEPAQLLYIGSGMSSLTSTRSGKLLQEAGAALAQTKARIHCLPLGNVTDQDFLGELAKCYSGTLRPLDNADEMVAHVTDLLQDFGAPLYSQVRIDFEGVKVDEVYPKNLPNVSAGRQLLVFGKYLGQGQAKVKLTAQYKDTPYEKEFLVDFGGATANTCIPPLWATRKIEHLQRESTFAEAEASQRLVRTVVETSKRYTVMSQYTSFLVLESPEDYLRYGIERRVREFGPYAGQGGESAAEQLRNLESNKRPSLAAEWDKETTESSSGDPGSSRDIAKPMQKLADRQGQYDDGKKNSPSDGRASLRRSGKDWDDDEENVTFKVKSLKGEELSVDREQADGPERLANNKPARGAEQPPATAEAAKMARVVEKEEYKSQESGYRDGRYAAFQTDALSWGRADIFPVLENPASDPLAHWPNQWKHSEAKALEILRGVAARLQSLECKINAYQLDKNGKEVKAGREWAAAFDAASGKFLSRRAGEDSQDVCDGQRLARYFPLLKYAATRAANLHDFRQFAASLPGFLVPWTDKLERDGLVTLEREGPDGLILRIANRGDDKTYLRIFLETAQGPVTKVEVYQRQQKGAQIFSVLAQTIQCEEFKELGGVRVPLAVRSFQFRPGASSPGEIERLKQELEKLTTEGQADDKKLRLLQAQLAAGLPAMAGQTVQRLTEVKVNFQPPAETFEIAVPKDWSVRNVDAQPKSGDRKAISTPLNPSLNNWGR